MLSSVMLSLVAIPSVRMADTTFIVAARIASVGLDMATVDVVAVTVAARVTMTGAAIVMPVKLMASVVRTLSLISGFPWWQVCVRLCAFGWSFLGLEC